MKVLVPVIGKTHVGPLPEECYHAKCVAIDAQVPEKEPTKMLLRWKFEIIGRIGADTADFEGLGCILFHYIIADTPGTNADDLLRLVEVLWVSWEEKEDGKGKGDRVLTFNTDDCIGKTLVLRLSVVDAEHGQINVIKDFIPFDC